MTDEDHGPLFSGTERDLYRVAFENVTAAAQESYKGEPVTVRCENCGNPEDRLERCETCLFFLCAKCTHGFPHKDIHERDIRHEERA